MNTIKRLKFLFASIFLIVNNGYANSTADEWASRTTPVRDPEPQSIGTYNGGCLSGAQALPTVGIGYQVMRLSRNRYYGHPTLVRFIQELGQLAASDQLGTFLVGDLGQARGGPTPSGHRSHQTGLDVDIWFLLDKQLDKRILTGSERENWSAPSVVDLGSGTMDYRRWTPEHEKLLQYAASQNAVERIFVNPSIKQELCRHKAGDSAAWLRKIRPWWKHDDHFHVRLKCPDNNPHCQNQVPLPPGDGCDSLAWWFSEDAKRPSKTKPTPPPPLPALCQQVLQQD